MYVYGPTQRYIILGVLKIIIIRNKINKKINFVSIEEIKDKQ